MNDHERAEELHYAVRRSANTLDHKLTVEEAHAEAMRLVAKMHAVWEAAHGVDKVHSRDAPMLRIVADADVERALQELRDVLDTPVSSFETQ